MTNNTCEGQFQGLGDHDTVDILTAASSHIGFGTIHITRLVPRYFKVKIMKEGSSLFCPVFS